MHTTCTACFYKQADIHETNSVVIIYCQNCGNTVENKRKNPRIMQVNPLRAAGVRQLKTSKNSSKKNR